MNGLFSKIDEKLSLGEVYLFSLEVNKCCQAAGLCVLSMERWHAWNTDGILKQSGGWPQTDPVG